MPTQKRAPLTLAEAREAARYVKSTRKSKKPPKAARGSKLWEQYLGHFGDRVAAPRKKTAARKNVVGASNSPNGSPKKSATSSVKKTATRKRSTTKSSGRRAS